MRITMNITDAAAQAIARFTGYPLDMATKRKDGTWDCPIKAEMLERIRSAQYHGETISETLLRIVHRSRPN